jgi:hypothetical protein
MAGAYTNGWSGWPCPTNADWQSVSTNHYFFQLYTALVERAVNVNVSLPPIVDANVSLYNGFTNNVETTNGVTVTNPVIQYKAVSLTNQFIPFLYTYSNAVTSGTATCNPPVRRSWFTNWDNMLFSVCTAYVNTNALGTDGTFNAYFQTVTSQTWSAVLPTYSATSLFHAAGIGWTNRSVAHWTQAASVSTSDWLLASIHSGGTNANQWTFKRWTDLASMHPCNALFAPVAEYIPAGSNVVTNLQMTVSGNAWGSLGSNVVTSSEIVTFTDNNNVPMTNAWRAITNISCSSARSNSNDAFRVTYRTLPTLYDSSVGWRLTPESLNERKRCLDAMTITYRKASGVTDMAGTKHFGGSGYKSTWAAAQAAADAAYAATNSGIFEGISVGAQGGQITVWSPPNIFASVVNGSPFFCFPTPVSTNFSYQADLYVRSIPPSADLGPIGSDDSFDAYGSALLPHQYAKVSTTPSETSGTCVLSFDLPDIGTNRPTPPWCVDVTTTDEISYGYKWTGYGFLVPTTNLGGSYTPAGPSIVVFRWAAGTNGFRYK